MIFYPLTKLFCFRSGAQTDSGSEAKFQPFLTAIRFATTKSHSARFYCMVPICLSISRSHTHAIVQTLLPTHTHLPITHKPTRTASGTSPLVRRQTLCPVQQQQSEVLQCRSQCSGTHSCHWANRARAEEPVFSNPPLH